MFNTNKTVLYFVLGKVFCRNFFNKKTENFSLDWNTENLTEVFTKIKAKMKADQIKIILGHDLSYVLTLKLAKEETNSDAVAAEIKKYLPGEVTSENFRFEVKGQDEAGKNIVQIFAVSHDLLKSISAAAKTANVKIEFIVPVTQVLAENLKTEKKTLFFWEAEEKVGLIINNKTVYIAEKVDGEPKVLAKELILTVKENFGFEPEAYMAYWPEKLILGPLSVTDIKIDVFALVSNRAKEGIILEPMVVSVKPVIESKKIVKPAEEKEILPAEEPIVEPKINDVEAKNLEAWKKPVADKKVSNSHGIVPLFISFILIAGLAWWFISYNNQLDNSNLMEKNSIPVDPYISNVKLSPTIIPSVSLFISPSISPSVSISPSTGVIDLQNTQKIQDINTIENGVSATPEISQSVNP